MDIEDSTKKTEKIRDKGAGRFQKTRKTTAKMGGLCEERSEKGRGGRKVERKGQQQGPMEINDKRNISNKVLDFIIIIMAGMAVFFTLLATS